jgi:excisionase family DNA binding protein
MNTQIKQNFLTIRDIREYLNISLSAAYELTHRKDFPVCRIGGCIRIPRKEFLAWVQMKTSVSPQLRTFMSSVMEVL